MKIDENILRELLEDLNACENVQKKILQRALTPTILQHIIGTVDKRIRLFEINYVERTISQTIKYTLWYILWIIKWILFLFFQGETKIITGSLFSYIKTSLSCAYKILDLVTAKNIAYINYGIINDYRLLFSSRFFCFPYFIYKWRYRKINVNYEKINDDINRIIKKHINGNPSFTFTKEIHRMMQFYKIFDNCVDKLKMDNTILCYISDTDHIDNRSIVCDLHKKYGIKTILIDHALNTFSQVNNQINSDMYFCWGRYHYKKCGENLSQYKLRENIIQVGNPTKKFMSYYPPGRKRWIYILPSFQHQIAFNISRNFERTFFFVQSIKNIVAAQYPHVEFIMKPHPVDKIDYSQIVNTPQTVLGLDEVISNAELVFVEDSTSTIELLQYSIPLVYITNINGDDLLEIRDATGVVLARDILDLSQCISDSLRQDINMLRRQQVFEYHFGKYDPSWIQFTNAMNKVIALSQ
jgi:hypothetical protein